MVSINRKKDVRYPQILKVIEYWGCQTMEYAAIHVIHLLCAIAFIGVVFFEVLILEGVRQNLLPDVMTQVEEGLVKRAKKIMPWVVGTIFVTGAGLAYHHMDSLSRPLESSFGLMLLLKIALALSVLVHFVTAIRAATNGCMESGRFKNTHLSVAIHMFFIVLLAKGMFYISW